MNFQNLKRSTYSLICRQLLSINEIFKNEKVDNENQKIPKHMSNGYSREKLYILRNFCFYLFVLTHLGYAKSIPKWQSDSFPA